MLWPQNFKKYNLLCWDKGDFCLEGGGLVVCRWEELGLGRRRRNRGEEGRERGYILTFADRFTNRIIPSVILSAIPMVNRACHCTEISDWIPRWFHRHFKWWISHVNVRSCRFESLGDSVGKNHPQKPPRQRTTFFLILNILSVISSVTTDRMCPSVYTSGITDGKNSVGNGDLKLPIEVFRR